MNDYTPKMLAQPSMHYMNADNRLVTFNVNLEDGVNVFRSNTKTVAYMNGDLRHYNYDVFCSEDILIGYMVQSILIQDMGPSNPLFRHGGLCSPLYLDLKNLRIKYRGHAVPIAEAQMVSVGTFLATYSSPSLKSRLQRHKTKLSRSHHFEIELVVGTMSVGIYPPCCCTIPKLIWPDLIPWNRYDVFKPEFDFSAPVKNSMMRDTDQNEEIFSNNQNPNIAPAIEMVDADNANIFPSNNQGEILTATLVEDTCENNIKRDNTEHSKKVLYKTKPERGKTKFFLGVEPEKTLRFAMTRDSFADKVSAILTLTHPGRKKYVAYKIEITNPSRYLVGQNLGIVAPGTSEYINFVLVEKEKQKLLETFDCLGEPVLDHSKGALVVDHCVIDESFGKNYIEQKHALTTDYSPATRAKASKDLNESLTIMWDKLSSEEDSRILSRKLRVRYVVTASLENEHPSKVPAEEQSDL